MSRDPPQRRSAARETALPLTPRRQFAGGHKAQVTARKKGGVSACGYCRPAVDVRLQTLAGWPETALRVRRSLPHPFAVSGVWLDDRTRSGREPKESPDFAGFQVVYPLRRQSQRQEEKNGAAWYSSADYRHT